MAKSPLNPLLSPLLLAIKGETIILLYILIYFQESSEQEPDTSKNEDSDYSDDFKNLKDDNEELDDETLFKVLKFLAENDYIITKRTIRVPAQPTAEQSNKR